MTKILEQAAGAALDTSFVIIVKFIAKHALKWNTMMQKSRHRVDNHDLNGLRFILLNIQTL